MSEERARYQSGAAEPELTPDQRAERLLSAAKVPSSLIHAFAAAITEAEERGRLEEREACAGYLDEARLGFRTWLLLSNDEDGIAASGFGADLAEQFASAIRARSTALPLTPARPEPA